MDKQNENHSASKNPILSSLLDSQKVNDNRKRSNQEEHEEESEEYVTNMNATLHFKGRALCSKNFGTIKFCRSSNPLLKSVAL